MRSSTSRAQPQPTWTEVKKHLTKWDHAALLGLLGDLYRLSKDNQAFLHARLGVGEDPLRPYKDAIARWMFPDLMARQDYSVAKAKKALSDYRKAAGDKEGLLELMTFFCEEAAAFATDIALDDEGYYDALVKMFGEALSTARELSTERREPFVARLLRVGRLCAGVGYYVGDDLEQMLSARWIKHDHPQLRSPV